MSDNSESKIYVLDDVFNIDDDIKLTEDELETLEGIADYVFEMIEENGLEDTYKIQEIISDMLSRNEEENIINYLNLQIETDIKTELDKKLEDSKFLKIEESESKEDIFNKALNDNTINDIIYSFAGYDRKVEGQKEVFIKKRESIIPTTRLTAIYTILLSEFNRTSFLSNKDDNEIANVILMIHNQVFDQILEMDYRLCDTTVTIEILGTIATKLANRIGMTEFRKDILEAVGKSFNSSMSDEGSGGYVSND